MTDSLRTTKLQPEDRLARFLATLEARSKLLAFFFGLCFVAIVLVLAIWFPSPTPFQYMVFRIILAIAAAGVAGVIPGMIRLKAQPGAMLVIHAGGALAVFVIVYLLAPAALPPEQPVGYSSNGGVNQTFNNNQIGTINNTVNNYGLTKELFEEDRKKLADEIVSRLQNAESPGQRALLENKLKVVQEQLADKQKSYEEELKKRKDADEALTKLQGSLPESLIEIAQQKLRQGDTETAEKTFDSVVEKGNGSIALAAYQSGQLAERRLDYEKSMRLYRKAVVLEKDNPDYLLAAGHMATQLSKYKQAEEWLERLRAIVKLSKQKTDTDLSIVQEQLAYLCYQQGKYEKAELLYRNALANAEKNTKKEKNTCGGVDSAHIFKGNIDSWCQNQNLTCCKESTTAPIGFVEIGTPKKKRYDVEITWEQLANTVNRKAIIKIELIDEKDKVITSKLSPNLSGQKGQEELFKITLADPKLQGMRLKIIVPSAGDYAIVIRNVVVK
jgi:tetratricopeptide (TPR) repeat protein